MDREYLELHQYKEYVVSTQRLNEALNQELNTCYERIGNMMKEVVYAEGLAQDYLKEIQELKTINQELKLEKQGVLKTKASERILSYESIGDSGSGSAQKYQIPERLSMTNRRTVRMENRGTQTKKQRTERDLEKVLQEYKQRERHFTTQVNLEIERLQTEILSYRYQLEVTQCQLTEMRGQNQVLKGEVKRWEQKCEDIQNMGMKNVHEMMTEKEALLYEGKRKDQVILGLEEKVFVQSKELARRSQEGIESSHLREKIVAMEVVNKQQLEQQMHARFSNQELLKRISSLQEHIIVIEGQNSMLKNSNKQQERRENKSIEVRKSVLSETELKMVKHQYTQAVKQNINLVEVNSKLEKKRGELTKEVEIVKREKAETLYRYNQLLIQYEHLVEENQKKCRAVEDMNNKIILKENEAQILKTKASQDIIDKLEKSLSSPMSPKVQRGLFDSVRRNNFCPQKDQEVPVKDVSRNNRLIKSKSTVVVYGGR